MRTTDHRCSGGASSGSSRHRQTANHRPSVTDHPKFPPWDHLKIPPLLLMEDGGVEMESEPGSEMLAVAPGGASEEPLIEQSVWGAVRALRERGRLL
jgi:hypothetical protein